MTHELRVAMIGQKGYPPVHGGIERHVAELAVRLARRGIAVDIYSRPHYSDADGPTPEPGVRVLRRASLPTKHLDAISHTAVCTLDSLGRDHDVVHYHALGPGLLAGVPRWLRRRPTVTTVHGLDWQREKWGAVARSVLRWGERASARLPDRTVVVSQALAEHYARRHGRETVCIPNGIPEPTRREPQLMEGLGVRRPYVLFVGRLVPEKGCHVLLDAYARLPEELRAAYGLVVAGDAGFTRGYADGLRARAVDGVHFTGYVHGPVLDELYSNATAVCLPSSLEGLSIALLESMSYGNACLVTDIPPNLEAGGDTVRYVPAGDADRLADGLADLLRDPEGRARLAAAARTRALGNYSWETAADATAALYRELCGRR